MWEQNEKKKYHCSSHILFHNPIWVSDTSLFFQKIILTIFWLHRIHFSSKEHHPDLQVMVLEPVNLPDLPHLRLGIPQLLHIQYCGKNMCYTGWPKPNCHFRWPSNNPNHPKINIYFPKGSHWFLDDFWTIEKQVWLGWPCTVYTIYHFMCIRITNSI